LTNSSLAGWTALHYAAVSAPPSLVAHLISHGSSPLAQSRRKLTPLDVITAYEPIEERASVALLLAESMRNLGWKGVNKRDEARKRADAKHARLVERRQMKQRIGHVLELEERWWGEHDPADSDDTPSEIDDDDEIGYDSDTLPVCRRSVAQILALISCSRHHRKAMGICSYFPRPNYPISFSPLSPTSDLQHGTASLLRSCTYTLGLRVLLAIITGLKIWL